MRGKFVTIEGCEGVGKSTAVSRLKRYCAENGIDALFTREPGGVPVAEKIRGLILDAGNAEMTGLSELFLYAAARAQHTAQLIIPALRSGRLVVCDRYSDSTLAYQCYARGLNKSDCETLNRIAECGVRIDLTVFLNLSPQDGFKRKGGADSGDRLEKEDLSFHSRVYEGFKRIASENPGRVVSVDASKDRDEVIRSMLAVMRERGILV